MRREGGGGKGGRGNKGTSGSKGGDRGGGGVKRRPSQDGTSSSSSQQNIPPIAQLTIRTHHSQNNVDNSDGESMGSSASEITYGTRTDYSKGSSNSQSTGRYEEGSGGSGPHRVTRMPFTDAYGDKGWYTGEVASGSGLPHGQGTMHYCDGRMRSGWWSNGLAGGPPKNNARGPPPPSNNMGPPPPATSQQGQYVKSGNSVSSPNSHQHYNNNGPPPPSSSHYHPHPQQQPPPPLPSTNGAVFNIEWTDLNGKDGYYTGETDESGEPHGMGSMRYLDNTVLEGEWYHGELETRIHGLNIHPAGGERGNNSDGGGRSSRGQQRGGPVPARH